MHPDAPQSGSRGSVVDPAEICIEIHMYCLYIYMYIYIYIYICSFICLFIYVFIYLFTYLFIYCLVYLFIYILVGGIPIPPKNMSSSVGMMKFPIYGKIKFMFQTTNQYAYIIFIYLQDSVDICL